MTSNERFVDYPSPAVSALAMTASGLLVTLVVVPLVLGFLATWTARQVGQASNSAGCVGVFALTAILAVIGWLVGYSLTYQ